MRIPIDHNSIVPLYRQIEGFLREQIETGALPTNTKLPPNRKLAELLGVSRIVVANAYAELESHGLVYSKRGSGTFVAPIYSTEEGSKHYLPGTDDPPLWQQQFFSHSWEPGFLRLTEQLSSILSKEAISFSERTIADKGWPQKDIQKAIQKVFAREGLETLGQSGLIENQFAGYPPLRKVIAQILSSEGIPAYPEDVMVTSGSQQAISLVTGILLKPGDIVLVESPTYNVAIDLFRARDYRMVSMPVDHNGMDVERVEEILKSIRPKLIYTIPTFHNPTGTCMSPTRRRQLVYLAAKYNTPIFEDDFIGNLRFEGRSEPALKALDRNGVVIYAGTFTKMLIPGLRVGFLVAHGPVFKRIITAKYVNDLATSEILQRVLAEYISVGRYHVQLKHVTNSYRQRRDVMLTSLDNHFRGDWTYTTPRGGGFVWVKLPERLSGEELLKHALMEGVNFVPGSFFFPGENPKNYLRLNFGICPTELIPEGIKRLRAAYNNYVLAKK